MKKGMTAEQLVLFIIAAIVVTIGIILLMSSANPFKQAVKDTTSCGGAGITKGVCINTTQSCEGITITGLGCPDASPVCCSTSRNG